MTETESSFKNSLRNFRLTRGTDSPIALPTNSGSSTPSGLFQSFRESTSSAFSNISTTVQGYNPLSTSTDEEEEPWYQLSRVEVI
jgi:hypothetical protein